MRFRVGFIVLSLLALAVAGLGLTPLVYAQVPPAYQAPWAVSVTYQNVGQSDAPVSMQFYDENGNAFGPINPYELVNGQNAMPAGAGGSYFVGRGDSPVAEGFQGNAILTAQEPLVATAVQLSTEPGYIMRLLSNGFQASEASDTYLIATALLNQFQRTSIFSIQNVNDFPIVANVKIYQVDQTTPANGADGINHTIPANSSKYVDMGNTTDTALPDSNGPINGSVVIQATRQSDGSPASIVAAVSEYYVDRPVASNFEGVPVSLTAPVINMPTALCQAFGLDTFYAVQNADLTQEATVVVDYFDNDGNTAFSDQAVTIAPGGKQSIRTCGGADVQNPDAARIGFSGSAVIRSTNNVNLAVIGRAQSTIVGDQGSVGPNFIASFLGQANGFSALAIPFARWANDTDFATSSGNRQRSFLAIQNIGDQDANIRIRYIDKNGITQGTQTFTVPSKAKQNSNPGPNAPNGANALGQGGALPGSFGYYEDGTFGGGAIVDQDPNNPSPAPIELIATVRVQHPGAGEDYNGPQQP